MSIHNERAEGYEKSGQDFLVRVFPGPKPYTLEIWAPPGSFDSIAEIEGVYYAEAIGGPKYMVKLDKRFNVKKISDNIMDMIVNNHWPVPEVFKKFINEDMNNNNNNEED